MEQILLASTSPGFPRVHTKMPVSISKHSAVGKGSRRVLSREITFSFYTTNCIYLVLPTATLHKLLHELTSLSTFYKRVQSLRSVTSCSTLSLLQQWDVPYLTYCRPTGDSDGSSYYVVSLRLLHADHISLTSGRHILPPASAFCPPNCRIELVFLFAGCSNACHGHYVRRLLTSDFHSWSELLTATNCIFCCVSEWRKMLQ